MRDIDVVIGHLRVTHPEIVAQQLSVLHPGADDDGLWFFSHPESEVDIQLESDTGTCPLLIERSASADRFTAATVEHAVALVVDGLGLSGQQLENSFKPKPLRCAD